MGQGNIKYRKIKRTPQTGENAGKELWYATVVTDREMSFEEFVDHISSHNSPYSPCRASSIQNCSSSWYF